MSSRIGLNELSMVLLRRCDYEISDNEEGIKTAFNIVESEDTCEALALFYENKLDYKSIDKELYDKVVYYYEKAIELNPECNRILFNYSDFWRMYGNIENYFKYLEIAAEQDDKECILILVKHYYETKDMHKFLYYFLKTEYTNDEWGDFGGYERYGNESYNINNIHDLFQEFVLNKILDAYDLIVSGDEIQFPDMTSDEVEDYIGYHEKKLRNRPDVCAYIVKKGLFTRLNNVHECVICYEKKLNICLDCGHEVCLSCYKRTYNDYCYFCRF